MPFYALQIVCSNCDAASLFGGGAEHDLTRWRDSTFECRGCGATTPAADARAVGLRGPSQDAEVLEEDPVPA
jgi:hypothetical protein